MALSGRLALVTGGASGIGKAVCQTLANEGAIVVVADKQLEEATKVAESLSERYAYVNVGMRRKGGAKHHAIYVDVGDSSSVEQLFSCMRSTSALPLAIVVNSAGIYIRASLVDTSDEMFDETIRVNLRGTFLVTRAAAREMTRSENVLPEGGAAIELAVHGIRCNAVLPGLTRTPMTDPLPEESKEEARSLTPLKRFAKPSEIAEAVKYLCSPSASSFVTGAAIEVTGGFLM
ncbi:hypothetical protein MRX96_037749 [Rhipicephalus microplus]